MFVRDFIHVRQPFTAVAPRFVSDTSWLAPIAEEAAAVARDLSRSLRTEPVGTAAGSPAPVGAANGSRDDRRAVVRCEVGPVRARAHSILVPMWLIDEGADSSLPELTGDLEVAPVGSTHSLIALGATYRRTTRERDELQRVERAAEVGVRTFLNGIAGHLGCTVSPV